MGGGGGGGDPSAVRAPAGGTLNHKLWKGSRGDILPYIGLVN